MAQLTLHCFARPTASGWTAICTSLDIAVDGSSFADAKARLKGAVEGYLKHVSGLPEADQKRLLNRRAPLRVRIGLWMLVLVARMVRAVARLFNGRFDGGHGGHGLLEAVQFRECRAA